MGKNPMRKLITLVILRALSIFSKQSWMINFTLSLCSIEAFLFIFNQSGLVQMLDLSGLTSKGESRSSPIITYSKAA